MAKTAITTQTPGTTSPAEDRPGMRWTVCAMLFLATSINYMDRQVIAILKPTLEHSIGLTEVNTDMLSMPFRSPTRSAYWVRDASSTS